MGVTGYPALPWRGAGQALEQTEAEMADAASAAADELAAAHGAAAARESKLKAANHDLQAAAARAVAARKLADEAAAAAGTAPVTLEGCRYSARLASVPCGTLASSEPVAGRTPCCCARRACCLHIDVRVCNSTLW